MEELAGVSEDDNNLLTCTMILEQNENDCRSGDGRSLIDDRILANCSHNRFLLMKCFLFIGTALVAISASLFLQAGEPESKSSIEIRPPAGRLAIVADGNSPDPDDIGASAVIFGLLKGAGLQERLVHFSHSCDLDPFTNPGMQKISEADELRRQAKLQEVFREGIELFGPFKNLTAYHNCRTEQEAAVNHLRDAINASSSTDPLWIVEAGEPDIIGYALKAATESKRKFVHVISHHPANDNSGDNFTWQEILDFGVTEHQIGDQNKGLQTAPIQWDWAKSLEKPGVFWIWKQLRYAEQDGTVKFQTNKFDCSDAGMIYWWFTGADKGGNRKATPADMKALLFNAVSTD
jgi:hypothetical protein